MVKETLVNELRKHLKEIEKEKGKFTLVILARMKDQWPPRRWRFALAAPWIDEVAKRKAIAYFYPKIFGKLDPSLLALIEDIAVFYIDHPLVREILEEVGAEYQAPLAITNRIFGSIEIEEAILL